MQRLDIAEVARLARETEQASSSQDNKLKSEDDKPKLDKSSNQVAGERTLLLRVWPASPRQKQLTPSSVSQVLCIFKLCCAVALHAARRPQLCSIVKGCC